MDVDVEFNSSAEYTGRGIIEASVAAEEHGFSGVWKGEANSKDPIVLLSALAERTESVDLGTAIVHPYSKTPTMAAEVAATLNDVSDNRFVLGIGAGTPAIASWHGKEMYSSPLTSVEEYITIVREILETGSADYDGEYFGADNFNLAFDPVPDQRIYLGALGPKMSTMAGRLADGVIGNNAPPEHIAKVRENAREGAKEAGKDPDDLDITCKIRVAYADDYEDAREPLTKVATFYSLADFYSRMFADLGFEDEIDAVNEAYDAGGFHEARKQITDEMLETLPFVPATSPETVEERLAGYEEIGVDRVIICYVPTTDDPVEEGVEFVRELAP
ncbi:MAG: LLM class flavin-dependent oxidoreductase [Halobacteriales archaeon]